MISGQSGSIEKRSQLIIRKRSERSAGICITAYHYAGKTYPSESNHLFAEMSEDPSDLMSLSFMKSKKRESQTVIRRAGKFQSCRCDLFAEAPVFNGKSGCDGTFD